MNKLNIWNIDRIANEINQDRVKNYIQENPEQYKPELLIFSYGVYLTAKQKKHADRFFNLREYIQKNPEQYKPEHQHLFTREELENLCQSLR